MVRREIATARNSGPLGRGTRVVRAGECLLSIAAAAGPRVGGTLA
jgi:hypothetical protein